MAKQIGKFEIIIRGVEGGPAQCFRRYIVQDSVNPELRDRKESEISAPDFNKVFHNTGATGELWKDLLDQTKSDEGIA